LPRSYIHYFGFCFGFGQGLPEELINHLKIVESPNSANITIWSGTAEFRFKDHHLHFQLELEHSSVSTVLTRGP